MYGMSADDLCIVAEKTPSFCVTMVNFACIRMIHAIVAEKTNEFSVTMNYVDNMSVEVCCFKHD